MQSSIQKKKKLLCRRNKNAKNFFLLFKKKITMHLPVQSSQTWKAGMNNNNLGIRFT